MHCPTRCGHPFLIHSLPANEAWQNSASFSIILPLGIICAQNRLRQLEPERAVGSLVRTLEHAYDYDSTVLTTEYAIRTTHWYVALHDHEPRTYTVVMKGRVLRSPATPPLGVTVSHCNYFEGNYTLDAATEANFKHISHSVVRSMCDYLRKRIWIVRPRTLVAAKRGRLRLQ